jgi:hypothetical protein
MGRILFLLLRLYLLAAIATRVAEASGRWRKCGCSPDCWCKKPGLSLFRWVVPVKHRSLDADAKRALAATNGEVVSDPVAASV